VGDAGDGHAMERGERAADRPPDERRHRALLVQVAQAQLQAEAEQGRAGEQHAARGAGTAPGGGAARQE